MKMKFTKVLIFIEDAKLHDIGVFCKSLVIRYNKQ